MFRRLGPAGPLAIINATLPILGSFLLLSSVTESGPWLQSHGTAGLIAYVIGFALLTGFSLLSNNAPTILGGWAFKFSLGLPAAMVGMFLGATIGYGVARFATGERVTSLINEQPKWRAVATALIGSGPLRTIALIALMRLCTPFAVANFVLAATRVPYWIFMTGTIAGLLPRAALIVYTASQASRLNLGSAEGRWALVGGIVALIVVVTIISKVANRALARATCDPRINPPTASPTAD